MGQMRERARARLRRQFELIERRFPRFAGFVQWLRADRARLVRVPMAFVLMLGGMFSFLPVLGIWMLPLGLMLLAVDLPFLQGPVSRWVIRGRIVLRRWLRKGRT